MQLSKYEYQINLKAFNFCSIFGLVKLFTLRLSILYVFNIDFVENLILNRFKKCFRLIELKTLFENSLIWLPYTETYDSNFFLLSFMCIL